jgi:hypothetical protein
MNRITGNLAILIIAGMIMAAASLSIIVSGFVQSVSAQGDVGTTGAGTNFGSSNSTCNFFKGTSDSVSSSGKDSGCASGGIAICGSTVTINGVCTKATD